MRIALMFLLGALTLSACAPNTTIQVSVPTVGTIDITVGQAADTPAPPGNTPPAPQATPVPSSGTGTGLSSAAATFLYLVLAVIGIIVVVTAFVLFSRRPDQ